PSGRLFFNSVQRPPSARSSSARISPALLTQAPDKQDYTANTDAEHKAGRKVSNVGRFARPIQNALQHGSKRKE
ncbi:MAG TPA: hypothetical protein VD758_12490, partial [Gemmatimonadaceae bacterium]|nr:hypothetical protein [Gemmatimonadaceae bacterium]